MNEQKTVDQLQALLDDKDQLIAESYQVLTNILSRKNMWHYAESKNLLQHLDNLANHGIVESVVPFDLLDCLPNNTEAIEEGFKTFGINSVARVDDFDGHVRYGTVESYKIKDGELYVYLAIYPTDDLPADRCMFHSNDLMPVAL